MSNIGTYNTQPAGSPVSYAKTGETTEKVQKFVKYLHDFLPVLAEEFDDLERLQAKKPNDKFPVKMQNLSAIYQAAGPLYDLYVVKAKQYAG